MGALSSGDRSPVYLTVDAGTGSARVLAFDLDGELVAQAATEWTHLPVPGHPGGTTFDTRAGWRAICTSFHAVLARLDGRPVAAVAASSMREGFVLHDAAGEEIWACPNTDGRARRQAAALVEEGVAARVYDVAGDWVSITAPARLRWLAEEAPEVLERTRHLGMLSDWVTFRLTGEHLSDPTCASSSALVDLSTRTWSPELADLVGVDLAVLPPVVACGDLAGRVTATAAAETGLPAGTPVAVGGADTQLALHAIGSRVGTPTVVAGSFWQTTAVVDQPVVDPGRRLRTLCHVEPGTWMVEGIGFLSGLAMRWFRDAFCPDALAGPDGESAFARMERWAAEVPAGSHGVVAVLAHVMQADAWHHAAPAFVGFDVTDPRTGRAACIRAVEEAAAHVARHHLDVLQEITGGAASTSGRLVFTGGSSAGLLWPRIVAGTTGHDVVVSRQPEATSYGAARLAARAVGHDLPPAPCAEELLRPDPADVAAYDEHFGRWLAVYESQVAATAAAGTTPLFTPPGGLPHRPVTALPHHVTRDGDDAAPTTRQNTRQKESSRG